MWKGFFRSLLPAARRRDEPPAISADVCAQVDAFLDEAHETETHWDVEPKNLETGRDLLALNKTKSIDVVLYATARLLEAQTNMRRPGGYSYTDRDFRDSTALRALLSAVLRKKLPFTEVQLRALFESANATRHFVYSSGYVRQLESFVERNGLPESLRGPVDSLVDTIQRHVRGGQSRKLIERINNLLHPPEPHADPEIDLDTGEVWATRLEDIIQNCGPATADWWRLLAHCQKAKSSNPSKKWLKQARELIEEIGLEDFSEALRAIVECIGRPGQAPRRVHDGWDWPTHPTLVHDVHSDMLRGLVWCAVFFEEDEALIQTVGSAAEVCFQKIPQIGPRAPKIGNACLWALSNTMSIGAVAQLSRLLPRVKHASVKRQLAKALDTSAANLGMSRDDLVEVAVPTFGMTDAGLKQVTMGEFSALLQTDGGGKPQIFWIKPDGKRQKTVPKAVKDGHPEELKDLKATVREIDKMLPALRERIESLFLADRSWAWRDFRNRYLDHPLVGVFARRLIWRYEDVGHVRDGLWHDGTIIGCEGSPPSPETRVTLWHPLDSPPEGVAAWRECLHDLEISQPFKQAHREIYRLTDEERQTGSYSNRFAAHILKQHQFQRLCEQRGWRYSLQGAWDSLNTPALELPHADLRVEFHVSPADESLVSGAGIYLFLATDRLEFSRLSDVACLPLETVPPRVFSEVMRDVDLFVGVCSVANDPDWEDGGPQGAFRDYWRSRALGDLGATAETRRAVLERLIPLLPFADRCSLEDRFLAVRGDLRSYRIHLGSGNILMSPNDEFLVIPAGARGSRVIANVYVPFEGDDTLSTILAQATLLADESRIRDESILDQIRTR